jgi:hypothetical protein
MPFAHERWFEFGDYPTDWGFAGDTLTLVLLGAAVAATLLVRLLARAWPGVDIPFLGALVPYMPFAIRLHLTVSLVGLLSLGFYLSPAMDLEADLAGILLGVVMALVAISMATGWHARTGAALLVAAGPLGMLEFGFLPVLSRSQAAVLIAGIPFNATLWFFGANELMGHLPVYGTMLVLLVYGSDARLRPLVARLTPPRAVPAATARR